MFPLRLSRFFNGGVSTVDLVAVSTFIPFVGSAPLETLPLLSPLGSPFLSNRYAPVLPPPSFRLYPFKTRLSPDLYISFPHPQQCWFEFFACFINYPSGRRGSNRCAFFLRWAPFQGRYFCHLVFVCFLLPTCRVLPRQFSIFFEMGRGSPAIGPPSSSFKNGPHDPPSRFYMFGFFFPSRCVFFLLSTHVLSFPPSSRTPPHF